MALTDSDRLRSMLGEEIPAAGSEADTLFTDVQVSDLLSSNSGDLALAAVAGWRLKAANYASLVDVTEGNSSRKMSDLHKNALAMAKYYEGETDDAAAANSGNHVVIGVISRRVY